MTIMDTLSDERKEQIRISDFCAAFLEKENILTRNTRYIGDKLMDALMRNETTCKDPDDSWSGHITTGVWLGPEDLPEITENKDAIERCLQRCLEKAPVALCAAACLVRLDVLYKEGDTILDIRITLTEKTA